MPWTSVYSIQIHYPRVDCSVHLDPPYVLLTSTVETKDNELSFIKSVVYTQHSYCSPKFLMFRTVHCRQVHYQIHLNGVRRGRMNYCSATLMYPRPIHTIRTNALPYTTAVHQIVLAFGQAQTFRPQLLLGPTPLAGTSALGPGRCEGLRPSLSLATHIPGYLLNSIYAAVKRAEAVLFCQLTQPLSLKDRRDFSSYTSQDKNTSRTPYTLVMTKKGWERCDSQVGLNEKRIFTKNQQIFLRILLKSQKFR